MLIILFYQTVKLLLVLADIGINLTNQRFDKDRSDVIARAKNAGVNKLIITGTSEQCSKEALVLCRQYPELLSCTAGVHPHDADNVSEQYLHTLTELAKHVHVKAIGECGLDFNRNFSTADNQLRVFQEQVLLAEQLSLPLFLHQRDAFEPWLNILTPAVEKVPAMISHCFTGNKTELLACLDHNMYIGITGWLCDKKRGNTLRDIVKYIPLNRLLIETDGPYLTPQNIRPKPKNSRNEPAYLPYIVDMLVQCTSYTANEISEHSYHNTCEVFQLNE